MALPVMPAVTDETTKQLAAALARARIAEAVNDFAQGIALKLSMPELVQEAICRTRELLDADGASLLLVDPATGELCFEEVDGEAADGLRTVRLKPGHGVAGRVAVSTTPLLVKDASSHAAFDASADSASGFSTGSLVAAPLVFTGDVLGVLEAVRKQGRAPFTEAELSLLSELVPHVTIAVQNAQITARLRRMQDEQLRVNERLEKKVLERSAQIATAKREWEATIDAINSPIALLDGFTVKRANLAWARLAAVPVRQVVGKKCHELLAGRSSPCPGCPLIDAIPSNTPLRSEQKFGPKTFELTAFWLSDAPDERNVVVTYDDVTAERGLQKKLRESERLASIGELASGAAHEINNPLGFVVSNLSSLKGMLEELRSAGAEEELVGEGLEMIDDSLNGARRVQDIVRALRQLSKQEVGASEVANVNESLQRVARNELGPEKDALRFSLNATSPAQIAALHLDQALGHILKNARQAIAAITSSGGGLIHVRSHDEAGRLVLEIEDEGCGIAPEHLSRVFDPFFSTRGIGKGTGLGLTAAYGIIKRVGGDIDVRSQVGVGSCFTVYLPAALPEPICSEEDDVGLNVAVAMAQEVVTAS
ncbi:MAG: ATP-binding protein [Myxococcaceae bacterium]